MSHKKREEYADVPDSGLIRSVQDDPESKAARQAAGELLHRYENSVYAWCFRFTGNRQRALDLAQDVLLSAWRGIAKFQHKSGFSSWLFAITRNRCLSEVRRPDLFINDEPDPEITMDHSTAHPDEVVEYRETEQWVRDLMTGHLDRVEQDAVSLRCFEGFHLEEISKVLGIDSTDDIRVILQRARRKLRAAAGKEKRFRRSG